MISSREGRQWADPDAVRNQPRRSQGVGVELVQEENEEVEEYEVGIQAKAGA